MTAKEARALIGKRVEWDATRRSVRGYSMPWRDAGSGILEEVTGRNVKVDGSYHWLPDLNGFRAVAADENQA